VSKLTVQVLDGGVIDVIIQVQTKRNYKVIWLIVVKLTQAKRGMNGKYLFNYSGYLLSTTRSCKSFFAMERGIELPLHRHDTLGLCANLPDQRATTTFLRLHTEARRAQKIF